ncbi:MAG: hypothetical protein V5A33_01395 [Halobacteriales archaeon]
MTHGDDDAWATGPRDTRERTCGHAIPPVFSVRHVFRVARDPATPGVTVTRTYEATVEWTSDLDLPGWLAAVADVLTPYGADRFGDGDGGRPDPAADGRFLAAPVEATVRPGGSDPIQSEPYHYWNTPLARLQADDGFPEAVVATTVDLIDGPETIWTGASTGGGLDERALEDNLGAYSRVGVSVTGRERFRRSEGDEISVEPGSRTADWEPAGERSVPDPSRLDSIVDATIVPEVRAMANTGATASGRGPLAAAVERVGNRIDAGWTTFERSPSRGEAAGERLADPYSIPDAAVRAAIDREDP